MGTPANTAAADKSKAAAKAQGRPLGDLPRWNLRDLYPGIDSKELRGDLKRVAAAALRFEKRYKGKLAALGGDALGAAIADYERLQETIGRITSYAGLVYCTAMNDPKIGQFRQTIDEQVNGITTRLLFVTLDLNRIPEAKLKRKLQSRRLARYRPWLRDIRVFRDHQLAQPLEELLHEKTVAGPSAWQRLFDETVADLRFPVQGEELTLQEAAHRLSDKRPAMRRAAAFSLGEVFGRNLRLFATITNTLAKDKEIEDRIRKLPSPEAARHLSNHVEPKVVAALHKAVRDAYPRLSHRYYRLKARWMGADKLNWWDRNAPLPEDEDRLIPWTEAQRVVLEAYGRFSPELAAIGEKFFAKRWIDAPAAPGKAPGAFSHSTVPSAHPYILMNYLGQARDVMTLAHELGHGVHQVLAAPQGLLLADTPLTLAETASVFGEQLTFRAMLAGAGPKRRRIMLAQKVEDMLNTVVRQIAFYDFERRLHAERKGGELTADRICELWMAVQGESLGPAITLDERYRAFWCYIPHFIHSPFYVYAYAFGDCLVNALYARYREQPKGFEPKYRAMLAAGGTLRHKELLAPFGLDATAPGFWAKGLDVIGGFIDELETLPAPKGFGGPGP
jgi:oligoendopeptidase F